METKILQEQIQKYVRLPGNEIITFPKSLEHFTFKHLNPVTAGSCIVDGDKKKVFCFGDKRIESSIEIMVIKITDAICSF